MKKITLLFTLLITTISFSQSLPLDFEVAEDDSFGGFNGTVASVVVDPTDSGNQVLEMIGSGAEFDGAAIALDTYVDLSDDSNNTITMDIWAPDATTRTHLLKFEGGSSGVAELYFDTTVAGWQTINIDFGPGLGNEYPTLVIFTDAGVGNFTTGTYYIDNIDGPNGAVIPSDPEPSGPAPTPPFADSNVYSIYNDTNNYTNTFPVAYAFGTVTTVDLDPSGDVNNALKYNFGVAGWGQGEGGPDDVSAYQYLTFDYWAGPSSGASGWNIELIDNDGTVTGFIYQFTAPQQTIVEESWQTVSIPLTEFTNQGFDPTAFFQWKFDPLGQDVNNAQIVYIDNILFTTTDILNNEEFELSEVSVYPNPTNNNWNIKTNNSTINSIQVFDLLGKQVLNLTPNSSETLIDASGLNNGIYFAKVSTDLGTKSIKLIKN